MNKTVLFFFTLFIFPRLGMSDRVTININTNVIEKSCTISKNSSNLTITLGSNDLRDKKVGIPFGETPFTISLEDCPANISTAYVKFTGESDEIMSNLLKNNNNTNQGAKSVSIGIYDVNKNNIDIKKNKISLNISHDKIYNTFDFFAYYIKTSQDSSPGKITSIVDFEISYD
ncbi:fimbrial protein [Providencia rettgeri]|uniref:fimbrial protein n=1 Tax=Providencia rettgeri TaxID=587 RepID=UPI0024488EF5|nr:fimbrial protein [Providencia rettgeri]MDH2371870.1 fimbrial protein [Providencia rettgeri]